MTTKINASTAGLTETVDTSGILEIQTANTTALIIDASQNANFASTGAITVPVGTTAQRPTGVNGMIRYNSNTAAFEFFANNTWTGANVTPPAVISVAPVISGSPVVGQNLTSTTGTWTGTVTGYYYQWLANSTAISNATANVFTLTSTQNNTNITCNVTAYNIAGNSTPSTSNTLGPVTSTYLINKSLRFRSSASAYLNRSQTSGNSQKWTWSGWVKRGKLGTSGLALFGTIVYPTPGNYQSYFYFNSDDTFEVFFYTGPTVEGKLTTTQVFRDPAAWYHIMVSVDTTLATADNRMRVYVNGSEVTAFTNRTNPSQNYNTYINNSASSGVGLGATYPYTSGYFDGYMAEVNFVDGQQLTPSSFGQTDSTTGAWIPTSYAGTYGTNGFYLPFSNTTSTTTLGYDSSGNGNNWTTNNISLTAGSTYDSMTDVPTLNNATVSNYCVLNSLACGSYLTLSNANLRVTGSATDQAVVASTMQITTPSYWECTVITKDGGGNFPRFGAISTFPANFNGTFIASSTTGGVAYRGNGDVVKNNNVSVGSFTALSANDVLGFALDPANQTCAIYLNNVLKVTVTGITGPYFAAVESYTTSGVGTVNFGQQPFVYTPPNGYVAVNAYNL